jgi:hypothetical protein
VTWTPESRAVPAIEPPSADMEPGTVIELHAPTVDDALARQVAEDMDTIVTYRNGNTALLEALMLTCWMQPGAEAAARKVLREAGMLTDEGPQWDALEERKKIGGWTWREAVRRLVKDPDAAAKLLAMGDTPPDLAAEAREFVARCAQYGKVPMIEQRPLQPLAMGHYETVISFRDAR